MTPAERFRAAATRLRERAEAATPGSHTPDVEAYIAMMHPPVALALADWLDDLASGWPWDDDGEGCVWDDGMPMRLEESTDAHALAVADAVLGGERS